jgi:hypothetical protein
MTRLEVRDEVVRAFPGLRIIAADRTKVTEESEQIVFLLETVDAGAFGARLDDARRSLIRRLAGRSAGIIFHEITASDPDIPALGPERESAAGVDVHLRSGT